MEIGLEIGLAGGIFCEARIRGTSGGLNAFLKLVTNGVYLYGNGVMGGWFEVGLSSCGCEADIWFNSTSGTSGTLKAVVFRFLYLIGLDLGYVCENRLLF